MQEMRPFLCHFIMKEQVLECRYFSLGPGEASRPFTGRCYGTAPEEDSRVMTVGTTILKHYFFFHFAV